MYINITIEAGERKYRLSVDERQRISAAYQALLERGLAVGGFVPALCKSALKSEWVSTKKTFKEQGIVSGDRLTARTEE